MTSLRLPEALESRLNHLASATRRSKSFLIKEALEHYLDDVEDAFIALERVSQRKRHFRTTAELLERIDGGGKKGKR